MCPFTFDHDVRKGTDTFSMWVTATKTKHQVLQEGKTEHCLWKTMNKGLNMLLRSLKVVFFPHARLLHRSPIDKCLHIKWDL